MDTLGILTKQNIGIRGKVPLLRIVEKFGKMFLTITRSSTQALAVHKVSDLFHMYNETYLRYNLRFLSTKGR